MSALDSRTFRRHLNFGQGPKNHMKRRQNNSARASGASNHPLRRSDVCRCDFIRIELPGRRTCGAGPVTIEHRRHDWRPAGASPASRRASEARWILPTTSRSRWSHAPRIAKGVTAE